MIEPDNITNFNRTNDELLEFLIFSVFVAGHNSHNTARALEYFLSKYVVRTDVIYPSSLHEDLYAYIANWGSVTESLKHAESDLQSSGIGCYKRNAKFLFSLATSSIDLSTATTTELEKFIGVGPKTSRFFILHSRKGVKDIAVLDTHILRYMGSQGIKVPASTPSGKRYLQLEKEFIKLAKASGKTVADFDLQVWKAKRIKSG